MTARKKTATPPPTVRVAIYTRKSTDEGLDQEFNSLDAQRQAVEAYVESQRGQGWHTLPEHYDDGGFSGANTDRPAFQRLLQDIEAGRVDTVAVYRIDRLSRSILDYVRILDLFERRGVAFVSVTEHFNTTTPSGRLVLNLLVTFAQFERETIAQRTKDKIRASRRRGLWTGGRPPLGYDVDAKRLVVNADEAAQVRTVFELYLDLGSLLATVNELDRRAIRNKTYRASTGRVSGGKPFDKNALARLLRHPVYVGRVRAGDEVVDGAHDAIVEPDTWNAGAGSSCARRAAAADGTAGTSGVPS